MIKSKKKSGLPAEEVEHEKKRVGERSPKNGGTHKSKPYPILEEDSFTPPDDDSAEVKYITRKNKA
jgi:hypothetical protein